MHSIVLPKAGRPSLHRAGDETALRKKTDPKACHTTVTLALADAQVARQMAERWQVSARPHGCQYTYGPTAIVASVHTSLSERLDDTNGHAGFAAMKGIKLNAQVTIKNPGLQNIPGTDNFKLKAPTVCTLQGTQLSLVDSRY